MTITSRTSSRAVLPSCRRKCGTLFCKGTQLCLRYFDKLRELQVDLRANPAIFIGGGSILFRSFVEESPLVAHADFVTDPKANAIGYGMLATAQLRRMAPQNHGGSSLRRDDKYRFSLQLGQGLPLRRSLLGTFLRS